MTPVGTTESVVNPGMRRLSCAVAAPIAPEEDSGNSVSVAVVVPETTYRNVPAALTATEVGAVLNVIVSFAVSTPFDAMAK